MLLRDSSSEKKNQKWEWIIIIFEMKKSQEFPDFDSQRNLTSSVWVEQKCDYGLQCDIVCCKSLCSVSAEICISSWSCMRQPYIVSATTLYDM